MRTSPYFSLVITSFNEGEWLKKTVNGILADESYSSYEIILVNDSSTDDSFAFLESIAYAKEFGEKKISVLQGEQLGVARGRDMGAQHARGEVLIFLDAHMEVIPGWLGKIAQILKKRPEVHLLGIATFDVRNFTANKNAGYIYTNKDISMVSPAWCERDEKKYHGVFRVPFIIAANFIIRKKVYEACGGFPAYMEGWGPEDRTLCMIAYYLGFDTYFTPDITIGHLFKDKEMIPQIAQDKKIPAFYNALASVEVLYPKKYRERVKGMMERWGKLRDAEVLMMRNKTAIRSLQKKLKQEGKRGFQDFEKDFKPFLGYLFMSEYEEALQFLSKDPKKALKLLDASEGEFYGFNGWSRSLCEMFILFMKAKAHHALKEYSEAMKYAYEGTQISSTFIPLHIFIARLRCDQKQFKEMLPPLLSAEGLFETEKEEYWKHDLSHEGTKETLEPQLWDLLSVAWFYQGNYKKALKYVLLALEKNPQDERMLKNKELYENALK